MGNLIHVKAGRRLCTLSDTGASMGVHTKASPPQITGAHARSKRHSSLPNWAQLIAAAPRAYECDVEIFGQHEPAEYLYKVVSGAVRAFSVLRDGRRHIAAFYLPGDF